MLAPLLLALCVGISPVGPPTVPSELPPPLRAVESFGLTPKLVRHYREVACRDRYEMRAEVWAWNTPTAAERWEEECHWRFECWDKLDDVLNCPGLGVPGQVRSLNRLRELIGDAAFVAGTMPGPTPAYRHGPQD